MQKTQSKIRNTIYSLTYKIFSSTHNPISFMHTKLPIGLFQNTQADPRSVKCSVKRLCRGHGCITTIPFLPLFLHPAVPILSGVHGQAEHHLRGRAGCHWTLLEGEIDGANNYATFFLHHQSGTPHRNVLHEGPQGGLHQPREAVVDVLTSPGKHPTVHPWHSLLCSACVLQWSH